MRIAKNDIPVRINVPGAVARQKTEFGDAAGYGKISGEYFSLGAGTDIAPLLQGLVGDLCQSPHWGYVISGKLTITYADGVQEAINGGDLFYWPPGHTVKVDADAEVILFSPQHEHSMVIDHMLKKMGGWRCVPGDVLRSGLRLGGSHLLGTVVHRGDLVVPLERVRRQSVAIRVLIRSC
jgi:hypothetical protein